MDPDIPERFAVLRSPLFWGCNLGLWTISGLLNSGSAVIDLLTDHPGEHGLWEPVLWELSSNYTFALLTPMVVELALRARPSRIGTPRTVIAHGLGALVFSLLHVGGMVGIRKAVYRWAGARYEFGDVGLALAYELFKDVMTYGLVVGLACGFDYYRRYRARELAASRLEASLAEARLENLRHRLQPHFLFNTLNLISATMHEDLDRADRVITRLSDLLRRSIQGGERTEVRLDEELAALRDYTEIMQARFEGRLDFRLEVEPGLEAARVPSFLLQPLVENSFKHGIEGHAGRGTVRVTADRVGSRLRIRVRDNGPGPDAPTERLLSRGVGLSSTAERLSHLYGSEGRLDVRNHDGAEVTVELPLRTGEVP
jgi:two-component sensor histidine kinase